MTIATLPEFTLHLDSRRLEMSQVKVVRTKGEDRDTVHLIGTVKAETEAVASQVSANLVFKTKTRQEREAIIRLLARSNGEILAFEGDSLIGVVVWDERTSARKLPVFMRRLLGISP